MRNHLAYSKDTTLLRAHIHTFLKKKIQKKRKIVYDFKQMRRVQRVVDGFPNSSFLDMAYPAGIFTNSWNAVPVMQ